MQGNPTVNVDRFKPFLEHAGAEPAAPGPVSDPGREGEHEMELLLNLNRKEKRGVTRYLVRWRDHTSEDDEWRRTEELAHCQERVAEYEAAAPRRKAAHRGGPPAGPGAAAVASISKSKSYYFLLFHEK